MAAIKWQTILDYIDAHVEQNPTVADISEVAGYSPFHFNRLFAAHMGIPVMEYMRIRKLQHAAVRVVEGERLLDIALHYGFASHESFTRAFTRLYGASPKRFRLLHIGRYTLPSPTKHHRKSKGEYTMEPKTALWKTRTLIGYRFHTQPGSAEIPAFWNSVMSDPRWQQLLERAADNALNYGLCIHPVDMPDGKMDYLIAFDYDGHTPLGEGMELFTLESAEYKIFHVMPQESGDISPEAIKRRWSEIYSEWFPSSGYGYDGDKPDFEVYDNEGSVEIYIPVVNAIK